MKIISIKKKNNKYELKLEKEKPFLILDETILKYNLYKDKELTDRGLEDILNYDYLMKYYIKCVNKIKYKKRTKQELITFLKQEEVDNKGIFTIIEKLENANLLNDLDYLKAFINDEVNLTLNGPYKIKTKLYKKGFNDKDINNVLNDISKDIWNDKINKLISKKIKSIKNKSALEIKTKIINDLLKEGYNKEEVIYFIKQHEFITDDKVLEKQYNKLFKKYQKKDLTDGEKRYLITQELYKKGYKENEIKKTVK